MMSEYKIIHAKYNENTVTVYQAFNNKIADEVLNEGRFGSSFNINRMTWIKPSFLWMMYRSGWGTKKDQERVLSINIVREGFDLILSRAVLTKYKSKIHGTPAEWKSKLKNSEIRCQWDPDRDIYGNKLEKKAIQLGLSGGAVNQYLNEWICSINDISTTVCEWREQIKLGTFEIMLLPTEIEYKVDYSLKKSLGMIK